MSIPSPNRRQRSKAVKAPVATQAEVQSAVNGVVDGLVQVIIVVVTYYVGMLLSKVASFLKIA